MMEIVPVDDRLLIETRLSPRDIAFIHPGQRALVKITAYDYAIYGGLDGVVETISPDTIQDKVKPEIFYYRVFIRTHQDYLQNKSGRRFSIVPGMIATVDIKTGEKTIVDYLIKPFNRASKSCASGKSLKIRRYGAGHACHKSVILTLHIGADSGFDGICETQGACRGAVGLVKSRKKIVANDETYALAA